MAALPGAISTIPIRRKILGLLAGPKSVAGPSGRLSRVAVFRPDHIGDLVLAAPAIERFAAAFPDTRLDLYVGPWSEQVARGIRGVEVKALRFPGFQRTDRPRLWEPYLQAKSLSPALRALKYDAAIVLRADHFWGAMLADWSGIPVRIGFDQPDTAPFLTDLAPYRPGLHEAEQNLSLVDFAIRRLGGAVPGAPAGRPRLEFPAPGAMSAERYAVFHPGAGAPVKRWRLEAFGAVGRWLLAEKGINVVVTGGPAEEGLAKSVQKAIGGGCRLAIGLSIVELAGALQRAEFALGPDSGVLHIASAIGTPTVRLYGPVDHRTFGPYRDPRSEVVVSRLACVPCNRLDYRPDEVHLHPCVQSIGISDVLAAIERILTPAAA